ncbi:MAG: AAA family ATPase [Chlorobium sp.]|nr:AAA family ATPase [Chlorobium sp.]
MIIKALTIENFKGISEPVRIEFKPITLLFGPNSAGKSTVVQALHYAREILERNNVDADQVVGADEAFDLGGFKNVVHKHDTNLPIKLKFELNFSPLVDHSDFFSTKVENAWIEYEIKWSNFLEKPLVFSTSVGIEGEFFARIVCNEDGKNARIVDINHQHHLIAPSSFDEINDYKIVPPVSKLMAALMTTIKFMFLSSEKGDTGLFLDIYSALPQSIQINEDLRKEDVEGFMDEWRESSSWETLNDFFGIYFAEITSLLRNELRQTRYIGPIRKTPPRIFSPVRTVDESRWSSGLAAWDRLYVSAPPFIEKVNGWLASDNRLNSGYRIKLKRYKELDIESPEYNALGSESYLDEAERTFDTIQRLPEKRRISMIDEARGVELQPHDIGIGISQVLPVVVAALDNSIGFIMVEQPELHIHPGLQTTLGDLFINQIGSGDKTFLLETHSEHLLLRLLRRIRETNDGELPPDIAPLTPDQLSVNYIEPTSNGLRIRQLLVSLNGDSHGEWPKGFFEERAGELF